MVTEMQQHRLKTIIAGSAIVLLLASSIAGAAIADYIMKPAPSETNMQESEEKIRALREAAFVRLFRYGEGYQRGQGHGGAGGAGEADALNTPSFDG